MGRVVGAALLLLLLAISTIDARVYGIRWSSEVDGREKNGTRKHEDRDYCYIHKDSTQKERCDYVQEESDKCEGGGYFTWTRFVMCQDDEPSKVAIIVASVLYLLYLFIAISSAADDFFSPNVAGIVAHLGISESIAGVTFLAFGNGAPDIFGSIASVLSSPKPKAGFAIGELLGAGIFVTLCVTATVVFTKPFRAAVFETVRDLCFYLAALGWLLFVFLYDSSVHLFQPLVFLGVYAVYVGTVVFSHFLHKKRKRERRASRQSSRGSRAAERTRTATVLGPDGCPEVHVISAAIEKINNAVNEKLASGQAAELNGNGVALFSTNGRRLSTTRFEKRSLSSRHNSNHLHPTYSNPVSLHERAGEAESDSEGEEMMWVGHHLISASANRSRAHSVIPPAEIHDVSSLSSDVFHHLLPISGEDWAEAGIPGKTLLVLKVPLTIAFNVTCPLVENAWSKPVALIHCLFAPQFFLFAIQEWDMAPISGGPGLWAFALVMSAVAGILICFFTTVKDEPKFYKQASSYAGFLMSIAWIYLIANEVVGVVTMLGVISQLSHEVLGLTILAWSNSIGDLIADVSVVKQGYPNMALAAALGGPLFNLLIGFGLPFSIARLKGTTVQIAFSSVNHILVLFLSISLSFTLVAMFVQRFRVRRIYAGCLVGIYVAFITMVVLAETGVFSWGGDDD